MNWIERKELDFDYEWKERPISNIKGITIHHTGGPTNQKINDLHNYFKTKKTKKGTKYPGMAYHIVINDEGVFVCNGFDRKTWHSAGNNSKWLSIAVSGNFEKKEVPFSTKNMIRFAIETVKAVLGNDLELKCHSDFKNTKCPGKHLKEFIVSEFQ